MQQESAREGWRSLLRREWIPTLAVLLGGVLLQSMNVLMLTTVLPSIVGELGGVAMLSWPTTAFLASSIVAASCAGMLAAAIGARAACCAGVTTFGIGAVLCSLATTMGWIVAGRLIQGFGGGLEAAAAYVAVRATFPEAVWSRTIALMSTSWSVSVLIGPLVGGMFASFGNWRGAFVATAVTAGVLAVAAFFTLRFDRVASNPLLPRDAFSLRTPTGVGLWVALLLCITYSPLQIYVPIFLQRLHGLDPLAAGFTVASASLGWTAASLSTAGASERWRDRLIPAGPAVMAISLMGIAWLTPRPQTLLLIPAIVMLGMGIGQCWPLVAQRIMGGARAGDEAIAASAVPTVMQMGFALGAAFAGLVANASGLAAGLADEGMQRAAFWVPASFVVSAMLAFLAGLRLRRLRES